MPANPLAADSDLTSWQAYRQRRDAEPPQPVPSPRHDWTWNETQHGYDGVHTYEGQLVWYTHTHNPHAGGAANTQSLMDFLQNGPTHTLPTSAALDQLYDAVQELVRQGASGG